MMWIVLTLLAVIALIVVSRHEERERARQVALRDAILRQAWIEQMGNPQYLRRKRPSAAGSARAPGARRQWR